MGMCASGPNVFTGVCLGVSGLLLIYECVCKYVFLKTKNVERTQIMCVCGTFVIRLILPNVDASL